jgi:hypothetical protein
MLSAALTSPLAGSKFLSLDGAVQVHHACLALWRAHCSVYTSRRVHLVTGDKMVQSLSVTYFVFCTSKLAVRVPSMSCYNFSACMLFECAIRAPPKGSSTAKRYRYHSSGTTKWFEYSQNVRVPSNFRVPPKCMCTAKRFEYCQKCSSTVKCTSTAKKARVPDVRDEHGQCCMLLHSSFQRSNVVCHACSTCLL